MLTYISSILSVFGDVSVLGMNCIIVVIDRTIYNNVCNRLFSLGSKRVGGNSSIQIFKVCGVDVKIAFN